MRADWKHDHISTIISTFCLNLTAVLTPYHFLGNTLGTFPGIWNTCRSHLNYLGIVKTTHGSNYAWQTLHDLTISPPHLSFLMNLTQINGTKRFFFVSWDMRHLCPLMKKSISNSICIHFNLETFRERPNLAFLYQHSEVHSNEKALTHSKDACVTSTCFAQKMP